MLMLILMTLTLFITMMAPISIAIYLSLPFVPPIAPQSNDFAAIAPTYFIAPKLSTVRMMFYVKLFLTVAFLSGISPPLTFASIDVSAVLVLIVSSQRRRPHPPTLLSLLQLLCPVKYFIWIFKRDHPNLLVANLLLFA